MNFLQFVQMMVEQDWELAREERVLANHRSSLKDAKLKDAKLKDAKDLSQRICST